MIIEVFPLQPGMKAAPVVRFGAFEVDLRAKELRKHGLKIKLQDQPFRVLQLLLQRPGELVTEASCDAKSGPPIPLLISTTAEVAETDGRAGRCELSVVPARQNL